MELRLRPPFLKHLIGLYLLSYGAIRLVTLPRSAVNVDFFLQDNPTWGIAFRETQTLWGVRDAVVSGFTLFNLETPVLGSPFRIPFEMPLFQNFSAAICKFLQLEIVFGTRAVSLICFCVTTYLYSKLIKKKLGFVYAVVFLFLSTLSPFAILWSGIGLIENFTNLLLALYVWFLVLYLDEKRLIFLAISFLFLSLTSLSKITTSFPLAISLYIVILYQNQIMHQSKGFWFWLKRISYDSNLFLVAFFSLIPGYVWSIYADSVKNSSAATEWLTSSNLQSWNFGTLDQRVTLFSWQAIAGRLYLLVGVTIFLVPFLLKVKRLFPRILILFFVGVSPVLVYFNLYVVHDYYFLAIHSIMCLTSSICAIELIKHYSKVYNVRKDFVLLPGFVLLIIFSTWIWTPGHDYKGYLSNKQIRNLSYVETVASNTSKKDLVIVFGCDWNPAPLFLMNRKGFTVPNKFGNISQSLSFIDTTWGLNSFKLFVDCQRGSSSDKIPEFIGNQSLVRISDRVYRIISKN